MSGVPFVDLVIPVHDISRPIRRAVESAIAGVTPGGLRVTVVCHGIESTAIAASLDGLDLSSVRLVEFVDGVASPAGPFNHGISLATAPYVSVMGSDDFLEPGAMQQWISEARRLRSAAVLVRLRYQGGAKLHNPLPRFGRSERLDAVKDRLYYRTSPLGLLSRESVIKWGPLFAADAPVGGDLNFSSRFWSSGERIDYLPSAPCYVIGDDAVSRITTQRRPVREPMGALRDLVRCEWVLNLSTGQRRSLAIKVTRIHILGALTARPAATDWTGSDLADLRVTLEELLAMTAGVLDPFSLADRRLLEQVIEPSTDVDTLVAALATHSHAGRIGELVTRRPWHLLNRESTLVRYLLYKVTR